MNIESNLLSKVVDSNCFYVLAKYNITKDDFYTQKDTYEFIRKYCLEYGECPAYTTVVAECKEFEYEPDIPDKVEYLCKRLKSDRARREAFELLQNEAGDKFNELKGDQFIQWLKDRTENIFNASQALSSSGVNWATNGAERKAMYLDVKNNKSDIIIPTPFDSLTTGLGGGFFAGDYVLLEAFTNKGKSWVASDIGVTAWLNGSGILHYSPELSKYIQSQRLDTLLGHFNNMAMRNGELYDVVEQRYFDYLDAFHEGTDNAPYIIKTMEDLPQGLSVDIIEADLQANPDIKMVIIDGFNLMLHKGGRSLRDSMTVTSRRLRQICGRHNVVLIVVHQISNAGDKESQIIDTDGLRLVNPPDLNAYSETIAVIQDACVVLSYDYCEGEGAIKVVKTRSNNLGQRIDLECNYNEGYLKEFTPEVF